MGMISPGKVITFIIFIIQDLTATMEVRILHWTGYLEVIVMALIKIMRCSSQIIRDKSLIDNE